MRAQEFVNEKWSEKYKRSINCAHPKGFSQRAHCQGRKKNEGVLDNIKHNLKLANEKATFNLLPDVIDQEINNLNLNKKIDKTLYTFLINQLNDLPQSVKIKIGKLVDKIVLEVSHWPKFNTDTNRTKKLILLLTQLKKIIINARKEQQQEQIDELTFRGSQCTKDCSGHAAGYEWSRRKGGVDAASWSPSFNKGAALFKNGY